MSWIYLLKQICEAFKCVYHLFLKIQTQYNIQFSFNVSDNRGNIFNLS